MGLFLGRLASTGELALGKHKIPQVMKADGWTAVFCHFYRLNTRPWINKSSFITGSYRLPTTSRCHLYVTLILWYSTKHKIYVRFILHRFLLTGSQTMMHRWQEGFLTYAHPIDFIHRFMLSSVQISSSLKSDKFWWDSAVRIRIREPVPNSNQILSKRIFYQLILCLAVDRKRWISNRSVKITTA